MPGNQYMPKAKTTHSTGTIIHTIRQNLPSMSSNQSHTFVGNLFLFLSLLQSVRAYESFYFAIGRSQYEISDSKYVTEEAFYLAKQAIQNGTCGGQINEVKHGSFYPVWGNDRFVFYRHSDSAINRFAEDCVIRLIFALKNIALPQEFITSPLGLSIIALTFAGLCIGLFLYGCIRKYKLDGAPVAEPGIFEELDDAVEALVNPALQGALAPPPIIPGEEEQEDLEMQAIADPQPPEAAVPDEEQEDDPEEAAALHPPAHP